MNEEERRKLVEGIKEAIAERLKTYGITDHNFIAGLAGRLAAMEQVVAERGTGAPAIRGLGAANPFEADAFKNRLNLVREGQPTTGNVPLAGVGIKSVKALTTLPSGGSTGFPTMAERGPLLEPVQPPLTLVDVLPSTPASGDSFEFVQFVRQNNAGVQQDEGDLKPETEYDAVLTIAKIATVAHWMQASRQVLSDNAQLQAMISRLLGVDVVAKYENLLLNGNGTTDKIHGLVPQATPFAHSVSPKADRISECLAAMWSAG